MDDLISRQDAIDKVVKESQVDGAYGYMDTKSLIDLLEDLPSAQPDLSDYSDKLWRYAYERGKREAQPEIIHCRECVYCGDQQLGDGKYWCRKHCEYMYYCSSAERREDET